MRSSVQRVFAFIILSLSMGACDKLGIRSVTLATDAATPALTAIVPHATWVTNGAVSAMAATSTTLYIAGTFSVVGPNTGNAAIINSTGTISTTSVLAGINADGQIRSAVPDGNGGYYFGGEFTIINGVSRNYIAHVSSGGVVDPLFNPNSDSFVTSLILNGTTLYVGGWFSNIGGSVRNHVAAFSTTTNLITAWNPNTNNQIDTMVLNSGTIYLGGQFTLIGGSARNRLAAVSAVSGAVSAWDPNANGEVEVITISGTRMFAGGSFTTINGGFARSQIAEISIATGIRTAWNPNAAGGDVKAITVNNAGNTVYAGGSFTNIGGAARSFIAALDATTATATTWNANGTGNFFYIDAITVKPDDSSVYVGGWFSNNATIGGQDMDFVAELSATTALATSWNPNSNGQVNVISFVGSDLFLAGAFNMVGGVVRNKIAAIDIATGIATSWNPNADGDIYSLVLNGSNLYVSGDFTNIGGQVRNYLASINTATGLASSFNPNPDGFVRTSTTDGTNLYVGGYFVNIGATPRNRIGSFKLSDGSLSTWNPNSDGPVSTITVSGNTTYFSGPFANVGGSVRNKFAAVNTTTGAIVPAWNPGVGADGWATSIIATGSSVFVAGNFDNFGIIGGQTRIGIAKLNNTTGAADPAWNANSDNSVNRLMLDGANLYCGGVFTSIGSAARNRAASINLTTGLATTFNPNISNTEVDSMLISGTAFYLGGVYVMVGTVTSPNLNAFSLATGLPL